MHVGITFYVIKSFRQLVSPFMPVSLCLAIELKSMKQLITDFPVQLHEALIIGQNYRFLSAKKSFANVVLTGLGGSGIGGSIIQNYVFKQK